MEKIDLTNLKKAFETLKQAFKLLDSCNDSDLKELIEDSCIQRFEYTYETAWKIMKKYLKLKYNKTDKELTMNNIFRYMQGYEIIPNWQNWELYNEKRNSTSHEYNIEKARESLNIIHRFIIDVEILIKNMEIYYND
jgi:nucleotidyltransferase substrate binding protein (TIGR01987 family)